MAIRVVTEEPTGIAPGDFLDDVIGESGGAELGEEYLRRGRPGGVGVRVVALPGDAVGADAVREVQRGRVGDETTQKVLAEQFRAGQTAEIEAGPGMVPDVAIQPVQQERDPSDPALR